MDKGFRQQVVVFAAVFLLLMVGMDWFQGRPITPRTLLVNGASTLVAVAIYGAILLWRSKRNNRGE